MTETKADITAAIDRLDRIACRRRDKAKDPTVKGLRPTATDWMTSAELERYQDLQAALIPHTRNDRAEAQERVRLKRAARITAKLPCSFATKERTTTP